MASDGDDVSKNSSPSSSNNDTDSDDSFYDALDVTPKSRVASLKKGKSFTNSSLSSAPAILVTSPKARETSIDLTNIDSGPVSAEGVLPDEIARELEALSLVDNARRSRIEKLERLRRGEDALPCEEDEEDEQRLLKHSQSTESSVEGIFVAGGIRTTHPFKVIEPDFDRRSVSSDSRSTYGRTSSSSRLLSGAGEVLASHKVGVAQVKTSEAAGSMTVVHIPDVVVSARSETAGPDRTICSVPVTRPKELEEARGASASVLSSVEASSGAGNLAAKMNSSEILHRPNSLIMTSTPRLHSDGTEWDPLPSPDSAVASLTRELETSLHTLDLQGAIKGQFVVKPQDDVRNKGVTPVARAISCPEAKSSKLPRDDGSSYSLPSDNAASPEVPQPQDRSGKAGRTCRPAGKSGHASSARSHYGQSASSSSSDRGSGGKRSLQSGGSIDSNKELQSREAPSGGVTKQMNMFLRTKSDSGKRLSDEEILKQIKVKNLDTGEEMDLVEAEDKLPTSINPLSLHIMRLTSEYVSGEPTTRSVDSDTESMVSSVSGFEIGGKKPKSKVKKLLGTFAKKTSDVAKSLAAEASKKKPIVQAKDRDVDKKLGRLATDIGASEGVPVAHCKGDFKRIQAHKSGPFDFETIKFAQELTSSHLGPIWCIRFSHCGQLLATAGQDTVLRIWVLKRSFNYFKDMRNRYNVDAKSSPTNSYENVISNQMDSEEKSYQIFVDTPFCSYTGHTSDLLDVSWSKNYFILTSSMDKTVRLWHISRRECLCCFQHIDFVTAISFHPRNDQFFLSGSLDGKLRLWNIPDKKVALWNEVDGPCKLITTANFIQNGKFAVVGTYDGRCIFYSTDQLKYYTMIHVRSARGKNSQGRKVTGIEPMPGEDKILVTSNDSRIRLYDLRDLSLSCKYRGYTNSSSQIRASFSPDGKYITAGSENQCVFIWRVQYDSNNLTIRKDRNNYYEAIKVHNAVVTCSVFAPNADIILEQLQNQQQAPNASCLDDSSSLFVSGSDLMISLASRGSIKDHLKTKRESMAGNLSGSAYVLISGDYDGDIKIFVNVPRPKHSSLPSPSVGPTTSPPP